MTNGNANNDLVVSFHVRARSVLVFNHPRWCYAVLFLVACVIWCPLQRAAPGKLLQRGTMHAHMRYVCTVTKYISIRGTCPDAHRCRGY